MGFFINAFNILLYQPLLNLLVLLYLFIPGRDFGIAVIVLTVLVRILFYPLGVKTIKSQEIVSKLQPKVKEIQEKYKNDKEKQAKELMELYKREKINPFAGFLPIFIQLPVLIALYKVFWQGLHSGQMSLLYSFVPDISKIDPSFLGIINLSHPNLTLAVLAGIFQFIQAKMSSSKISRKKELKKGPLNKSDFSQVMQSQMLYFFPVFTVIILLNLPAAIGLYWLVSSLFTISQQYILFNKQKNNKPINNEQ